MMAALFAAAQGLAGKGGPPLVTVEAARASVARFGPAATLPTFILGSQSASRAALLEATGVRFATLSPQIDEQAIGDRLRDEPLELVQRIALAKADALVARLGAAAGPPPLSVPAESSILLTGDQVVTFRGGLREKPADRAEARAFIESYAGEPCTTVQAVCLHDLATGCRALGVSVAEVEIGPLPAEAVDALVAGGDGHGDVLECAGGLMVEHPLVAPHVRSVRGGLDSVMGLSARLVQSLLAELAAGLCSAEALRPGGAREAVLRQRTWAVVGDVLNPSKPAHRIAERLKASGREVRLVNPRDATGTCAPCLADAGPGLVDAVNLVIAPTTGVQIVEEMHALGVRYLFCQPGADAPSVLARARALGLVVVQGCVLVEELPPPLGAEPEA